MGSPRQLAAAGDDFMVAYAMSAPRGRGRSLVGDPAGIVPGGAVVDEIEFDRMTRPHLPRLVATARRILGDGALAADAVQETLLACWLAGVRPDNPGVWLDRAVVHRSLALARSRRRRRNHESDARLFRPEGSTRDDPALALERHDLLRIVRASLSRLRPEHRRVLVLYEIEGRGYEAAARELGLPIGTFRSRLHRARAALGEVVLRALPELRRSPRD